jgi:hypothetical protein
MKALRPVLTGILSIGVWAAPLAGEAQPALEHFRFDPPQLCLRDAFRWEFSPRPAFSPPAPNRLNPARPEPGQLRGAQDQDARERGTGRGAGT